MARLSTLVACPHLGQAYECVVMVRALFVLDGRAQRVWQSRPGCLPMKSLFVARTPQFLLHGNQNFAN
jgi:hypothetical protein